MEERLKLEAFTFSITSFCTCKCKHCLVDSGNTKKVFLDKKVIYKLCKQIQDLNLINNNEPIAITGGEASFHPQLLDIVKGVHNIGFKKVNISMTGLGLSENQIKELAPLINICSISIDGNEKYHNWFRGIDIYKKSMWCLKKFKDYGAKNIAIQMSISKNNFNEVDSLVELAHKIGVNHVRLVPILPLGRAISNSSEINMLQESEYDQLLQKIVIYNGKYSDMDITSILDRRKFLYKHPEKIYGIESIKNIEVDQDGKVFFGGMTLEEYCIGNIFENELKSILDDFQKNDKYIQYNKMSKWLFNHLIMNSKYETLCLLKEKLLFNYKM